MRIDGVSHENMYLTQQASGKDSQPVVNHTSNVNKSQSTMTLQESVHATNEQQQASDQEVIRAIEKANKHIRMFDRRLEFSIHDMTKEIMVKVIDTSDDTVIREIPSEKVLDMLAHMWEVAGILVDEKR